MGRTGDAVNMHLPQGHCQIQLKSQYRKHHTQYRSECPHLQVPMGREPAEQTGSLSACGAGGSPCPSQGPWPGLKRKQ